LKKICRNIGKRKQHTLARLKQLEILKIEDELSIQESKIVWRWEKEKLPQALRDIIKEKQDNLRRRRFEIDRNAAVTSINYRLNKRAEASIQEITRSKTKKTLASRMKKSILLEKYSSLCTRRRCFICAV